MNDHSSGMSFLTFLCVFSIIEAISTLLLFFVAMPLKYMAGISLAVTIVGSVHGILFLTLVILYIIAIEKLRISILLFLAGIVGAVIPFGPFVVDIWLKRIEEPSSDTPGSVSMTTSDSAPVDGTKSSSSD